MTYDDEYQGTLIGQLLGIVFLISIFLAAIQIQHGATPESLINDPRTLFAGETHMGPPDQ